MLAHPTQSQTQSLHDIVVLSVDRLVSAFSAQLDSASEDQPSTGLITLPSPKASAINPLPCARHADAISAAAIANTTVTAAFSATPSVTQLSQSLSAHTPSHPTTHIRHCTGADQR